MPIQTRQSIQIQENHSCRKLWEVRDQNGNQRITEEQHG